MNFIFLNTILLKICIITIIYMYLPFYNFS